MHMSPCFFQAVDFVHVAFVDVVMEALLDQIVWEKRQVEVRRR